MKTYFTSESVTCGHPDKVCDQIADRILDEMLRQNPASRSACEVTCATDQVHIFGEVTTSAKVDYEFYTLSGAWCTLADNSGFYYTMKGTQSACYCTKKF